LKRIIRAGRIYMKRLFSAKIDGSGLDAGPWLIPLLKRDQGRLHHDGALGCHPGGGQDPGGKGHAYSQDIGYSMRVMAPFLTKGYPRQDEAKQIERQRSESRMGRGFPSWMLVCTSMTGTGHLRRHPGAGQDPGGKGLVLWIPVPGLQSANAGFAT
jgi:hypothetical protein